MNTDRQGWSPIDWLALAAGPTAWAANTQADYALSPSACGRYGILLPAISIAFTLVALAAAALAWRRLRSACLANTWEDSRGGHSRQLLAVLTLAGGVLFAVVIANQGAASLLIGGCLR